MTEANDQQVPTPPAGPVEHGEVVAEGPGAHTGDGEQPRT